jgi:hypothetical protein
MVVKLRHRQHHERIVTTADGGRGSPRKTWRQCVDEYMANFNLSVMDTHDRAVWRNGIICFNYVKSNLPVFIHACSGCTENGKCVLCDSSNLPVNTASRPLAGDAWQIRLIANTSTRVVVCRVCKNSWNRHCKAYRWFVNKTQELTMRSIIENYWQNQI